MIQLTRITSMVQDLENDVLQGVVVEEPQAKAFVKNNNNLDYHLFIHEEYGYSMVFPKDSELTEKFNEVLIEIRQSGKLTELREKWLF